MSLYCKLFVEKQGNKKRIKQFAPFFKTVIIPIGLTNFKELLLAGMTMKIILWSHLVLYQLIFPG